MKINLMNKYIDLLKQLRVVFIGIPDAGKSTLISYIIKYLYNKNLSPDTLMNELEYSTSKDIYGNNDTRTIKAAKIIMPYKDYEIMLIDAPGHLEYKDQIINAINMSSIIIRINDINRKEETDKYFNDNILPFINNQYIININTHTLFNDKNNFATNLDNSYLAIDNLINQIDKYKKTHTNILVDIEKEAKKIINNIDFTNSVLMFSGGKDSIVGYDLLKDKINKVIFPKSGYDFTELLDFINLNYHNIISTQRNIPKEYNYNNLTIFEIHKFKADFNNSVEQQYNIMCINYRASDEGVRSKDHYIKMGKYCYRFSPVFYFSEENIWRYIAKYQLPYCVLYHKGYRSLGDYPVTVPCMPNFDNINNIINYIHTHPFEERDGRIKQDHTEKYAMEKLRNLGFF